MESIKYSTSRVLFVLKRIPRARGVKNYKLIFLLFVYILFKQTSVYAVGLFPHSIDYNNSDLFMTTGENWTPPLGINGKVTDETGEPISGVSVVIKGSETGTTTNSKGEFSLQANPGDELEFTMIGYNNYSVTVKNSNFISVILATRATTQSEVVVVGYGTQKKINLTGAINQVSGKQLEDRVTPNLLSSLQGLVPNLNLSYGNRGGEPGSSPDFNLRGPGSLSGGSPFVLVDGVPQNMNSVNSEDIESISILKDASAAAIYGARAAYGVILITTKNGKSGKPVISYNGNIAMQKPTLLPKIVNSLEFVTMVNDGYVNAGQPAQYTPETIDKIKQLMAEPGSIPSMVPHPSSPNRWDETKARLYGNTNAYDIFYKKYGFNQDHNINVSGGDRYFNYFLSGGAYRQGSQFRYGDEYYHRNTLTLKLRGQVTNWLMVGLNTRYINRKYQMPHVYETIGDFYHDIPKRIPVYPEYDPNGHIAIPTLALMKDGGRKVTEGNELLNTFSFEIEIIKNWKLNAELSLSQYHSSYDDVAKTVYMYQVDNTPYAHQYSNPDGYSQSNYKDHYNSNNIYSTYEKTVNKHFFKLMAGVQSEKSQDETESLSITKLIADNVPFITTATGPVSADGSKRQWGTLGIFGRFNYNYDDKWMLEFSSRYDGSSRFGKSHRWGFFPSVSAGYNIAKEQFWEPFSDKISLLKFRASYGTLGNQSVTGSGSFFPYLSNLNIHNNLGWIMGSERPLYVTPPSLVSPDLTWETATTLNFGLDAEALRNRLSFSFDWYKRETNNMFGPLASYPAVLGVNPPRQNNASMETKGFELSLGWNDRIGQINYHAKILVSDNTTTITKYRNDAGTLTDYYVGMKLGEIWGYNTVGLFQSDEDVAKGPDQSFIGKKWGPGDVEYKDINGDGKVNKGTNTLSDPGDQSVIGNNTPRYSYGVNLGVSWKGFALDMLWQGVESRQVWLTGNFLFGDAGNFNQATIFEQHLDYWRPDNTDAYFPKPYFTSLKGKDMQRQTRYLQNAAYLRLKNLQLGYTFNPALANKLMLGSLKIFVTGENLLTFTKLIKTFDPEGLAGSIGAGKVYPLPTTYTAGITLKLK